MHVISKTEKIKWTSLIATVSRLDKTTRICNGYKVSVSHCIEEQIYPLPNIEDLFAVTRLPAIVFRWRRLYKSQLWCFQLGHLPSFSPLWIRFWKDWITWHAFRMIFSSLLHLRRSTLNSWMRCLHIWRHMASQWSSSGLFFQSSVEHLGHCIDQNGLHLTEEKVAGINEAAYVTNVRAQVFLWPPEYFSGPSYHSLASAQSSQKRYHVDFGLLNVLQHLTMQSSCYSATKC